MSERAQVGDTVRLTIEGKVFRDITGYLMVDNILLYHLGRTVEIVSRAISPLPSEPGTWWLDRDDDIWKVNFAGELCMFNGGDAVAEEYAPFRQLVLK